MWHTRLQLSQHQSLSIHTRTAAQEQPPGQILLVEGFKHILSLDESEQIQHQFETVRQRYILIPSHIWIDGTSNRWQSPCALPKQHVYVLGHHFRRLRVILHGSALFTLIDEQRERVPQCVLDQGILLQRANPYGIKGALEIEQSRDHQLCLWISNNLGALVTDVRLPCWLQLHTWIFDQVQKLI